MATGETLTTCATPSNVQVAVRLRPLSARERLAGANELLQCDLSANQVIAGPDHVFAFDSVHATDSQQNDIFDSVVRPVLATFLSGFNCTILAYGQTGSGKTFTMGTGLDGNLEESTQGIVPRAVAFIMAHLRDAFHSPPATATSPTSTTAFYEIYVSFLEVYNEDIIDLLAPQSATSTHGRAIAIREDARGDICMTGVREEKIVTEDEIFTLLQKGTLSRTTKSTEMNLVSSRSHAIFTLLLRQRGDPTGPVLASKLHFVDLAGSERLKRTNAQGDRVKESISINSGLLALGNVISALGDVGRKATHIPYRDSKLTRLLQDSLGGNSRTLMIACVSPSSDNFSESLNTLKYAHRTKNIQNRVQLNAEQGDNAAFEVVQLKKQVAALKQELLQLRTSRRWAAESGSLPGAGTRESHGEHAARPLAVDHGELSRLRVRNSELERRLATLAKEKAAVEAERDHLAKTPTGQLKTLNELRGRIAELELKGDNKTARATTNRGAIPAGGAISTGDATAMPQTPVWLRQANVLVERVRNEIHANMTTMRDLEQRDDDDEDVEMQQVESVANPFLDRAGKSASLTSSSSGSIGGGTMVVSAAQFAAAVATRSEALLAKVRSDVAIKEDLLRQFEICQAEYASMRRNYDDKLRLMHDSLLAVQRERDQALRMKDSSGKDSSGKDSGKETFATNKTKYEERIKTLGKELNETRARLTDATKALQQRATTTEGTMRTLKTALEAAKMEKTRLQTRLADETAKLRTDSFAQDTEIKELRQRERRAVETARKLRKAFDFQRALLQKRVEQCHQARAKIRQLLLAVRKRHISLASPGLGINLDSPSWRQLQSGSMSEDDDEESGGDVDMGVGVSVSVMEDDKRTLGGRETLAKETLAYETLADETHSTGAHPTETYSMRHIQKGQGKNLHPAETTPTKTIASNKKMLTEPIMLGTDDEQLTLSDQTQALLGYDQSPFVLDESLATVSLMDTDGNNPLLDPQPALKSARFPSTSAPAIRPSTLTLSPLRPKPALVVSSREVPRSALRHSPLIARRRDVFARLADAMPPDNGDSKPKKRPFK